MPKVPIKLGWAPSLFVLGSVVLGPTFSLAQTPLPLEPPATRVDDIVVEGRSLEALAVEFVTQTAAPARGRGLARWTGRICVSAVNLSGEAARYVVDRVSEVAAALHLDVGEAGCDANVVIIFTEDAQAMVANLADERRRAFRPGTSGLERGEAAFREFQTSDRAVRWWHLSMPVDAETGERAMRMPGDISPGGQPNAPVVSTFASRLNTQIRDDLFRALIVVDVDELTGVDLRQLADYLALVALAQIDPAADLGGYDTILNLFSEDVAPPPGLTEWDWAYLRGLYVALDAPQRRRNPLAQTGAVAAAIAREAREERQAEGEDE